MPVRLDTAEEGEADYVHDFAETSRPDESSFKLPHTRHPKPQHKRLHTEVKDT